MTWFRGMERRGLKINWIDALLPMEEKIEKAMLLYQKNDNLFVYKSYLFYLYLHA